MVYFHAVFGTESDASCDTCIIIMRWLLLLPIEDCMILILITVVVENDYDDNGWTQQTKVKLYEPPKHRKVVFLITNKGASHINARKLVS